VQGRIGKPVDLVRQKPHTGTHNAGYTECQSSTAPSRWDPMTLGHRIVTMLDVAIRVSAAAGTTS
jgi:hypothetical protein